MRNEESYLPISNYIQNNPSNWNADTFILNGKSLMHILPMNELRPRNTDGTGRNDVQSEVLQLVP